jgi:hypothetical protein
LEPLESERASRNESEPAYESLETRKDESAKILEGKEASIREEGR